MMPLREFPPQEIVIRDAQARAIFYFFWPHQRLLIDQRTITESDKGFAQALLVEAIEKSVVMGYVETLFRAATSATLESSLAPLGQALRNFVIEQIQLATIGKIRQYIHGELPVNLQPIEIYNSVRATIARNFRSDFQIRLGISDE